MENELLKAALVYASKYKWAVFPLGVRNKTPLLNGGCLRASKHAVDINRWWGQQCPAANVGIACGPSGLVVIDIDAGKGGYESWRKLGIDDDTVISLTGGGGQHLIYLAPKGIAIKNSVGKLGDGIDVRSNGGYIVAPPSIHPNGNEYVWDAAHHPEERKPLPLPKVLLDLLTDTPTRTLAAKLPERLKEGERNVTLTSLAGTMRRRGASPAEILAALMVANADRCDPVLPGADVVKIAESVGQYPPNEDTEDEVANRLHLIRDAAHAETLAGLWVGHYRWVWRWKRWLHWTGKVWTEVPDELVAHDASLALRAEYARRLAAAQGKEEVTHWASLATETCMHTRMIGGLAFLKGRANFLTDTEELDAYPWLLNVSNGTINLRTGAIQPHDAANLLTRLAPTEYDAGAIGTLWQDQLAYFLPNASVRRQVQRDLGISLVGDDVDEILPIWFGDGSNGKSTMARTLQGVLGDYTIQAVPNLLVSRRYEQHSTELTDLRGRRVVFSSEIGSAVQLDEAKVKQLTGGDPVRARRMREDSTEFAQTWTITLLCNHKPVITGTDLAIWRRIRLVPWEVSIPRSEQRAQSEVVAELLNEGPAVLRWIVEGLADWQGDPHWIAPEVQAATEAYRGEQDRLKGFLDDCCELGQYHEVAVGALYAKYETWGIDAGAEVMKKTAFGKALRCKGLSQKRNEAGDSRLWCGLRLSDKI